MRRIIKIHYKQNAHQKEFQDDTKSKILDLSCGFGGGKSYAIVMKAFQLSRLNRGLRGGCVVPSIPDYKNDLLPLFEEILEENRIKYRYHKTDKWFLFPWSKGKLHIASAEKKIRGPNWAYALINEVGLISHTRFKETLGRVRIKNAPCPQIAMSGTPEGKAHWRYEAMVEKPLPNSRIIYGDTRNNIENLNEDYIPTLESSYDEIMLDAYLRGLFVNMNGNRFYYAYDPAKNDDATIEQIEDEPVYVSLDYNVAPMIGTLWNRILVTNKEGVPFLYPDGSPVYRFQAFDTIEIKDGADTEKFCDALDAFEDEGVLDKNTTTIYPDPAGKNRSTQGPPDNNILRTRGWERIRVKLAAPRFRKRQLAVNNLLAKGLIKLNPIKCKPLKRDLENVEQDIATFEKVKTNPKLTHASDGMDYFIDIENPLSGQKPDSRVIKYR